jgi:hypothetical protein
MSFRSYQSWMPYLLVGAVVFSIGYTIFATVL